MFPGYPVYFQTISRLLSNPCQSCLILRHCISRLIRLLLFIVIFSGCATNPQTYKTNSIVYFKTGAEARALYYQAFNIARLRLEAALAEKEKLKPLAIVVDIDETVLDNSRYQVSQFLSGSDYTPESWKVWSAKSAAEATPGSVEFLQYAKSKNVHVFYVTNRMEDEEETTLRNLNDVSFPWADKDHFYPKIKDCESKHPEKKNENRPGNKKDEKDPAKKTCESKQSRREKIRDQYDVILYIGDNLSDFSSLFEIIGVEPRKRAVDQLKAQFGGEYIILPNPMYGDWENLGIYGGRKNLSVSEKDSLRKSALQGE